MHAGDSRLVIAASLVPRPIHDLPSVAYEPRHGDSGVRVDSVYAPGAVGEEHLVRYGFLHA